MSVRCQTAGQGSFPTLRRWVELPVPALRSGTPPAGITVNSSTHTPSSPQSGRCSERHSHLLPTATLPPREGKHYLHFTDKENGAFQAHRLTRITSRTPCCGHIPHCSFQATQGVHSPRSRDFGRIKGKAARVLPHPPPLGGAGSSLPRRVGPKS